MGNHVIALGRQFGSGGREIGRKLGEALGFAYYDRELLTLAAKRAEVREELLADKDEKAANPWLFKGFYEGGPKVKQGQSAEDVLYDMQSEIILELAEKGDCIIVGRNADLILAEHRPLKLFVYADLESRLRRCRERSSDDERFTPRELERKLRQVDQHRARHHAMLSDLPWGRREGYHLCVNTTGLSLKTLAPLVAEYARSWFSQQGTP